MVCVKVTYPPLFFFFFFNDTATTEIYTLSLHDALPICIHRQQRKHTDRHRRSHRVPRPQRQRSQSGCIKAHKRSEEHTSELQSQSNLVCRLLLEKKKPPWRPAPPTTPADHLNIRPRRP